MEGYGADRLSLAGYDHTAERDGELELVYVAAAGHIARRGAHASVGAGHVYDRGRHKLRADHGRRDDGGNAYAGSVPVCKEANRARRRARRHKGLSRRKHFPIRTLRGKYLQKKS